VGATALTRWARAMCRLLQWVLAGGVVVNVACTIVPTFSSGMGARPGGRVASRSSAGTPPHVAPRPQIDLVPTDAQVVCAATCRCAQYTRYLK
jgi:hypothetical protein